MHASAIDVENHQRVMVADFCGVDQSHCDRPKPGSDQQEWLDARPRQSKSIMSRIDFDWSARDSGVFFPASSCAHA
jgi:hypothetical protein